jgi:hypothetical protein
MKRKILLSIALISILIGIFIFLSDFRFWSVPANSVRIDFVNDSKQTIKEIKIGTTKIKDIVPGETETYIFSQKGEGAYEFDVEFSSGKTLKAGERYVETGYYVS